MRSVIQSTAAYELSVDISPAAFGHDLKLFSTVDLTAMRDCNDRALTAELHAT